MIGTYDYRLIAETLGEAYDLGQKALPPLICMYNTLQIADINPNQRHKTELQSVLRTTYAHVIFKHLDNQQTLYAAVKALNDYVLTHYGNAYGYKDLDSFLIAQFIEVPLTYAILSEQVGQIITIIGDSKARMKDINILMRDIDMLMNKIGWENV